MLWNWSLVRQPLPLPHNLRSLLHTLLLKKVHCEHNRSTLCNLRFTCPSSPSQSQMEAPRGPASRPKFDKPGRIDILLGVETFVDVVCQGRRKGCHNSPTAIETSWQYRFSKFSLHRITPCVCSHRRRPSSSILGG